MKIRCWTCCDRGHSRIIFPCLDWIQKKYISSTDTIFIKLSHTCIIDQSNKTIFDTVTSLNLVDNHSTNSSAPIALNIEDKKIVVTKRPNESPPKIICEWDSSRKYHSWNLFSIYSKAEKSLKQLKNDQTSGFCYLVAVLTGRKCKGQWVSFNYTLRLKLSI